MASLEIISSDLLSWRKRQLAKGGRSVDLDWLLDIGGGLRWSELQYLILDPNRSVNLEESIDELERIWTKHLKDQTPLQYLIGRCPWRDFELEVSSDVLIPRQETEVLIDFALERAYSSEHGLWADLGTGSGAIAVALARSLPCWNGYAVEISPDALLTARRNIDRLATKSKMKFLIGSWWEPLKPYWGTLDLVLTNPPYIPTYLIDQLDQTVRDHEPHLALFGGEDGLSSLREVISGSRTFLASQGWLILEHHHDQSEDVLALMKKHGLLEVTYEVDLQGIRRFAIGRNP